MHQLNSFNDYVVHVLAVGLSIFDDSKKDNKRTNKPNPTKAASDARLRAAITKTTVIDRNTPANKAWTDINKTLQAARANHADINTLRHLTPDNAEHWRNTASGELHTLYRTYEGTSTSASLPPNHTAILLTGNRADLIEAALWNAYVLAGHDPSRVALLDDPGVDLNDHWKKVIIIRMKNFLAETIEEFDKTMRKELGPLGRNLQDLADDKFFNDEIRVDFSFEFTSGYRAIIPLLVRIAEALKGYTERGRVQAHVIHSNAEGNSKGTVPYQLRNLDYTLLWNEFQEVHKNPDTTPNTNHGQGDAYFRCKSTGILIFTAYGDAFLALKPPRGQR